MKRALVCGAGGFVGRHLVKKLKKEGCWVRGVDIKERQSRGPGTGHDFAPTAADEFLLLDLREPENCTAALSLEDCTFDEVYQLAADMGGMGFIPFAECEIGVYTPYSKAQGVRYGIIVPTESTGGVAHENTIAGRPAPRQIIGDVGDQSSAAAIRFQPCRG